MNPAPVHFTLTRWVNITLIAVFGVLLWLPTIDTFFHIDYTPAINEKRIPAELPHFKSLPGGLKEYLGGLEACFNDHFGYRNQLIRWQIDWRRTFFQAVGESGPNVIIGSDGWLYYARCEMVEHYRGLRQFAPQNLRDWQALLEHRRDWLARRGIKYIFVVAPDKHSIYSEHLPIWMTKVRPESKLDQFLAYMRAHSTVKVLDLRPALFDACRIAPTYFKTDTHWNAFGGFVACQEIAKMLPGVEPLSLASFDLGKAAAPNGDLAGMLGLRITEENGVSLTPKSGVPSLELSTNLVGNPEYRGPFFTKNPQGKGAALVFCDSFGVALRPFLGCHFGKVTYLRKPELDRVWIEQEKPDVVICEMVEREFNTQEPDSLKEKDALN
ncbi:MAG: alginate O-acetyltransferase [Verrucomicrobiia bacterium]